MPSTDLICDKCGFQGSDDVVWGDFRYIKDGLEIDLSRTLGWCADCSDFVPMEDFAVKDKLLSDIDEALEAIKVRTKRWALFSLLNRKDRLDELERLSALIAQLALIGERKGCERCLQCGSVNVERFDGDYSGLAQYASKETTVNTGFLHPGCGGEFMASINPMRFHCIFEPRLFSVNGHRLDHQI
ncbi:hypothetical protein EYC98_21360 [Halieaceae bacterium IMCC14734]|uniref:Uncharacterized protein n=1 Tax=Candidatus Litorirhabdus singularis TaxID=2518993 RepID=A0ABT3TNV5_9GAMM|nr:hypothetical protein [Candidatus Litorirhabdus singularis]MCX2983416.1 hypothetical protein [Candidatus Litorirhabdus singularis]